MRRAIGDLEQFADDRLFEALSEGLPLIVENAASLDESASRLHREGEVRASEIMRGFAEEEAAKFLILIDYVRCPRIPERRSQVLKRFHGHVAKRIHAEACRYPLIDTFGDLSEFVESECRPWYLDGPNGVDWLFPNAIAAEREQNLYVDYMRDITDSAGDYHWTTPADPLLSSSRYTSPESVTLALALARAGAGTVKGLAEIADVWRQFVPGPDTDRNQLRDLIAHTLERLALCGHAVDQTDAQIVTWHWTFPMWPLTIPEPSRAPDNRDKLREERRRRIAWMEETEAKRDPPPAIDRSTVEKLSHAYADWQRDADACAARSASETDTGLRILPSAAFAKQFDLPSYAFLKDKLEALTDEERAALVALAWYARRWETDWPRIYQRAIELTPSYDDRYQIGLGGQWLDGLDLWEQEPQRFQAGHLRSIS